MEKNLAKVTNLHIRFLKFSHDKEHYYKFLRNTHCIYNGMHHFLEKYHQSTRTPTILFNPSIF